MPEIAPGITSSAYRGKRWPQVLPFEVISVKAAVGGLGTAVAVVEAKLDGYEGKIFTYEGVEMREIGGVTGLEKKPHMVSRILKPTALLQGTFTAKARLKDGQPDRSRAPVLVVSGIEVEAENAGAPSTGDDEPPAF